MVFDLVQAVDPSSLEALLGTIEARSLLAGVRKLREGMEAFTAILAKLAEAIIGVLAEDADNGPALQVIAAVVNQPIRYVNARALEQNSIELPVDGYRSDVFGSFRSATCGNRTAATSDMYCSGMAIGCDFRCVQTMSSLTEVAKATKKLLETLILAA